MISTRLQFTRLTPAIGAIAGGIDLAQPLADEEVATIREALDDWLVLFFPDQRLTPVHQRDFAARFGPLYRHPFYPGHADAPEIMILAHDATHRANSDRWHNDVTYLETPPQAAVLYAEEIPELGGDTLWANMYAAYEALSEPVKQLVVGLRAVHSFAKNFTPERFRALGMEDRRDSLYAEHPPVSHPVVRTNPASGCKALFVNQDFTSHIEGVSPRESEALLRMLFEHMAQPEFAVRWRWQAGAVAFWDNRWAQHCALADYFPARRRMRRATILGDRPV
ncbi:MAG: taurine dioxygenase [Candidatus Cybelea sp.]